MSGWRKLLILSWLFLVVPPSFAEENSPDLASMFMKQETGDQSPPLAIEDSVFMLSPGDKLRLQWWGNGSGDMTMVVDTRRKILVPEVGEIDAAGRTLKDLRDTLIALVNKRLRPRLVSVRLVEVQAASIWLTGVMPNPGPQQVPPGTRLSKALLLGGVSAGDLLRASMTTPPPRREDGIVMPSLRRILVLRNGKDTIVADLARAFRSGRTTMDPPLYSGDRVILLPEANYCAINAGLSIAGVVEFRKGDTVRTVLEAAGLNVMPPTVRQVNTSGEESTVSIDQLMDSCVVLLTANNRAAPDRRRIVFIGGRVPNPGAYFFKEGMTIRQLVSLAGGVDGGSDSGIVVGVRRGGVAILPGRHPGLEMLPPVIEVAKAYQAYLGTWRGLYSHGDLPLEPEDSVIVKSAQHVVWVGGRVARSGFVPWVKGRTWKRYIEEAGGFTSDAWEGKTQLIHPITEQPGSPEGEILPGSALLVPEKRYIPPEQWITISVSVVSLISSLVTIFILLDSRQ